jgi:hypothetical protein
MEKIDLKPLLEITEADAKNLFNFITGIAIVKSVSYTPLSDGFVIQYGHNFWIRYDGLGLITRNFPGDREDYVIRTDFEIVDYIRSLGYEMKPFERRDKKLPTIIKPNDPNLKIKSQVLLITAERTQTDLDHVISVSNRNKVNSEWLEMYNTAKAIYDKTRRIILKEEDSLLSVWLTKQRDLRNENLLDRDKIRKLNDINFSWQIGSAKKQEFTIPEDKSIRIAKYSKVNREMLSKHKINKIEKYISANILTDKEQKFMVMIKKADKFYRHNGLIHFPLAEKTLYSWANRMRSLFKDKLLSDFEVYKLNEIGFIWEPEDLV